MEADLHITDTQYLICLSIFFIPYALLDVSLSILILVTHQSNSRLGPFKYLLETTKAFNMAFVNYVSMGNNDGQFFVYLQTHVH